MIPLSAYVALSAILFMTGLLGVLIRRNFIIVLMSVEIMLNAATIIIKDKIINITFLSTFNAENNELFISAQV